MSDKLHTGHRNRLKQKLLNCGSDALSDHELFEILLFFSIPRINTNHIAHRLFEEFGDINGILSADAERLKYVSGIGDRSAELILTVGAIVEKSRSLSQAPAHRYNSLSSIGNYLLKLFDCCSEEEFRIIYFNPSMQILGESKVCSGSRYEVAVASTTIAREAILKNASGVILSHNHFAECAFLSSSDKNFTSVIEAALASVNVALIEHIVVYKDQFIPSMQMRVFTSVRRSLLAPFGEGFLEHFYNS